MAVYFQNISDDQFDVTTDFIVKESKSMNLVTGIFFLIMSFAFASMSWFGWILVAAALIVIAKGVKNKTVMVINKRGFYYYGELITGWNNFIEAEFIDDVPLPGMYSTGTTDCFYLLVKYYKEGQPGYYGRKIRFTDTQDKSEEEIIAAIKFYYKNCQPPFS